jgi:hypothetical protein
MTVMIKIQGLLLRSCEYLLRSLALNYLLRMKRLAVTGG